MSQGSRWAECGIMGLKYPCITEGQRSAIILYYSSVEVNLIGLRSSTVTKLINLNQKVLFWQGTYDNAIDYLTDLGVSDWLWSVWLTLECLTDFGVSDWPWSVWLTLECLTDLGVSWYQIYCTITVSLLLRYSVWLATVRSPQSIT